MRRTSVSCDDAGCPCWTCVRNMRLAPSNRLLAGVPCLVASHFSRSRFSRSWPLSGASTQGEKSINEKRGDHAAQGHDHKVVP